MYPCEMSLLMMLGKAQTPEDLHRLIHGQKEKVEQIVRLASEHVLEIIAATVWSLCMKMNVPQEEAEQCVQKVRERQMGYWFENMEKMDIQEERRNTAKAVEALEKAFQSMVAICKKHGASKEQTIIDVMEYCQLDQKKAEEKVEQYWE